MNAAGFTLSYPARTQLSLLEEADKKALSALFADDPLKQPAVTRTTSDGRFVSRTGEILVLWHKTENEQPEILSIISQSYLPEPG